MFLRSSPSWIVTFTFLFGAAPALSTQVNHSTLRRASEVAVAAFAGTVDSARTEMISGHVVTHFHFSRLKMAKGSHHDDTLTLHMAGGTYNKRRYWTIAQPEFIIGRRYILIVEKDFGSMQNLFLPVIGIYQGFYPIDTDTVTGEEVVHDWEYRPIAAISGGHIVSVDRRVRPKTSTRTAWSPESLHVEPSMEVRYADEDPHTRIDESAFLEVIRQFSRDAGPR
jgi:hypothetical protein